MQDISFDLFEGEILGIVGESGSGKSLSTLSLLKLQPQNAKIISGSALFEGEDLLGKNDPDIIAVRGKKIGMVFQDPYSSLTPSMKIGKQIMESLVKHKICPSSSAKEKALHILQLAGIDDASLRFEQYPHELSGGLRQRIMIALATSGEPNILIADEPTTALDATIQTQILELLKSIKEKRNMGIILITHDLGIIAGFCDRVLVMLGGRIIEQGAVENVLIHPQHPYTSHLLKSVRAKEKRKTSGILANRNGCPYVSECPFAMQICLENPPFFKIHDGHEAACWKFDPRNQ